MSTPLTAAPGASPCECCLSGRPARLAGPGWVLVGHQVHVASSDRSDVSLALCGEPVPVGAPVYLVLPGRLLCPQCFEAALLPALTERPGAHRLEER